MRVKLGFKSLALGSYFFSTLMSLCFALENPTASLLPQEDSVLFVKVNKPGQTGIAKLIWDEKEVPVNQVVVDSGAVRTAPFSFQYLRGADWTLVLNSKPVPRQKDSHYQIKIDLPFTGEGVAELELIAIGPNGEIEQEYIGVASKKLTLDARKEYFKRASISAGLSASQISYHDSRTEYLNEGAITFKAKALYFLVPRKWDVGGSLDITCLTFLSSSAKGRKPHFLGLNARVGYVVPYITGAWRLSVLGGLYYTTMFLANTPTAYGFSNVSGPQIYPTLTRQLGLMGSAYLYGKYSPVSASFLNFLNISSNYELAVGVGYVHTLTNGRLLTISADYSNLFLNIFKSVFNIQTYSLGFNYGI